MQTFARLALVCVPAWSWPLCHSLQTLSQACSAVRRQSESHKVTDDRQSLHQLVLTGCFTYDTDISVHKVIFFLSSLLSNIFFFFTCTVLSSISHSFHCTHFHSEALYYSFAEVNRAVRSCLCRKNSVDMWNVTDENHLSISLHSTQKTDLASAQEKTVLIFQQQ